MKFSKIVAIDVGSNAIRFFLAETQFDGSFKLKSKVRIPARLGAEAFGPNKSFSPNFIEILGNTFKDFSEILKKEKVSSFRAVATSAFREAKNSEVLAKMIWEKSGIKIEKISGKMEARLILHAIEEKVKFYDQFDYLLLDLGGGSLELSQIEHGKIAGSQSFLLGTVRLMNQINEHKETPLHKIIKGELKKVQNFLDEELIHSEDLVVIGTGGNLRRLLKLKRMIFNSEEKFVSLSEVKEILIKLENVSYEERIQKYNLKPDRADVIIPALHIVHETLKNLPVKKIICPDVGLADGVLLKLSGNKKE